MEIVYAIIGLAVGLIIGLPIGIGYRKRIAEAKIGTAEA